MVDLSTPLGKLTLKSPILTASGTCGFGKELSEFMDVSGLGGLVVKGTTLYPREGNPYPRMAETPSGMLNAVGLQNPGLDAFINTIYPQIASLNSHLFVNVSGYTVEEYVEIASRLNELEGLAGIELNISCPNVKKGGMSFGISPKAAEMVTTAVRRVYDKTLIVKLSPNVTDIASIALASERAGADAISAINTLLGMAIDAKKRTPVLATVTGGLSGAAIKPIALRMVWQIAQVVSIPVIGIGGIMTATDVVEFLLAGASAVQVGTATFLHPSACEQITDGLITYCDRENIKNIRELVGQLILHKEN